MAKPRLAQFADICQSVGMARSQDSPPVPLPAAKQTSYLSSIQFERHSMRTKTLIATLLAMSLTPVFATQIGPAVTPAADGAVVQQATPSVSSPVAVNAPASAGSAAAGAGGIGGIGGLTAGTLATGVAAAAAIGIAVSSSSDSTSNHTVTPSHH
ncbi:hypothetical protein [Chitinimonas taiwanensis]|uniref:Uncharacterized protein n=1 Tax=Chitinimonas taiwanensis DSM 18899 TaxID=1121279 RepID=A0A1K2HH64_9NEIS|nr:hypothetical protein [Chitinimonas taiwanensis]SFZ76184.1 hypothetical protein SAMN02745887_01909 [Chitinimonas taiwanensis DSM 18899]